MTIKSLNMSIKMRHFPDWIRFVSLRLLRLFLSSKTYGPIEFLLTAMATYMVEQQYGSKQLTDYFLYLDLKKNSENL